ncbi:MAG: hypothetical protein OXJ52_03795 [Oligoflexia bacterium]|nr:hypothetical protein [Oligoflexia bacterium]
MKTILSLLISLSCIPLVSTAFRAPTRPIEKPLIIPNSLPTDPAFKQLGLDIKLTSNSDLLLTAEKNLDRNTVQALNRAPIQTKEDAETIESFLKLVPALSTGLQSKGLSVKEAKSANSALTAAITQSVRENWEPETQANVIKFAKALALDPVANQKKLEEVKENCRL